MEKALQVFKTALGLKHRNLIKRWRWLERNYHPKYDEEIRSILEALKGVSLIFRNEVGWSYIDDLSTFMNLQIEHKMEALKARVMDLDAPPGQRAISELVSEVRQLIGASREELKQYKGGLNCLDARDYEMRISLLESISQKPLADSEIRAVIIDYESPAGNTIHSFEEGDGEPIIECIPLPKEPDEDDILGQHGIVMGFTAGYMLIGSWIFPIVETEDDRIGVPIEELLAEFGGCPKGFVNDMEKGRNDGYDMYRKRCSCCLRHVCPGGNLYFAWNLKALAAKFFQVKNRSQESIRALLNFSDYQSS